MTRGISFNAFTMGPGSVHPWYLAAKAISQDEEPRARFILATYYSMVRPQSLAEWHELSLNECPELASMPVYGWSVMPWSSCDPKEMIRRVELAQTEENRELGLDAGIEAGAKAFGPASQEKQRVEFERISRLSKSILKSGFQTNRSDYRVGGVFLVSGERWRWLPTEGMHRIPVAAGLGVAELPLRVVSVVRRDEVHLWPQVRSGLFSEAGAVALFDRLFQGRPPQCAMAWINWVAGQPFYEN